MLKYLAPTVDYLELESVHVLPWSIKLHALKLHHFGGRFSVDTIDIRYCISSLLTRTIDLRRLTINGAHADLRTFAPPASNSTEPFPGVFSTLDTGFGIALAEVSIDIEAELDATQHARLRIGGGDIEPDEIGQISFVAGLSTDAEDLVNVDGVIKVDQLEHGLFNAISSDVNVIAEIPSLPQAEFTNLIAVLKPTAHPPRREVAGDDGESKLEPTPETIDLVIEQQDIDENMRAKIKIDALYDGLRNSIKGVYELSSNEQLATPYLTDLALPHLVQSASGEFKVDITELAGDIIITSQTNISELENVLGSDPKVPSKFSLLQNAVVSFSRDSVTVEKMATQITDEHQQAILNAELPQAFAIALADPTQALKQANTLLNIDIGGILIPWFNAMLPDYEIVSGELKANFTVTSDELGNIEVAPIAPVVIDNISINQDGESVLENLIVKLTPGLEYTAEETRVAVQELVVNIGEALLASAEIKLRVSEGTHGKAPIEASILGYAHLDPILEQPAIKEQLSDITFPQGLSLHFASAITALEGLIRIDELNAKISAPDKDALVDVSSKQTFNIQTTDVGQVIENPSGELLSVALSEIDLAWLSPFTQPYSLAGTLSSANFTLVAAEDESLVLIGEAPLQISRLDLREENNRLLDNVSISLTPRIAYTASANQISYTGLRVSSGKRRLVDGSGKVSLITPEGEPIAIDASGELRANIKNLTSQPIVASALPKNDLTTPLSTKFRYDLSQTSTAINIRELDLELLHQSTPHLRIKSRSGITLRPVLESGENLAQYAIGEVNLTIDDLTPTVLADFLPADTISFDAINGALRLSSDGKQLSARTEKALSVSNVQLRDGDTKALLNPFDFKTSAKLDAAGNTYEANLEELSIHFRGNDTPALSGKLSATIEPEHTISLRQLAAEFNGVVPQLLDQPAILAGHALSSGSLNTKITVAPNGDIAATTTLDELASAKPLAVHTIEMPLSGNMRPDGEGFNFTMPLVGTGISGTSNAVTVGEYLPLPNEPALLQMRVTSDLFYLNDILATIEGIKPQKTKRGKPKQGEKNNVDGAQAASAVLDQTRDKSAFWDLLPYSTIVEFAFKQMFYTDYLAFHDIEGELDFRADTLTLNKFSSFFHDSPITLDGGLSFDEDKADPYTAKLVGKVKDFDLNQFFSELAPTKKSRIEGLFGVDIAVTGESPNAQQFRNRLLLDLKMRSRDGLYRPLPADSILMVGASDALGIIGEGLSYIPTGGFGAGAISRLVNYIGEIEYDSVDVQIKRDTSLDLKIERFDLLSPNIRLAATGTIDHVPGKDILESPLDVVANLNMVKKGAAILHSMNLLEEEQDRFGYWKGPEFKVWGSVANTESNFAEIIQRASDGTVKGGITRPLSGLVGNVKHRWFGGDAAVDDAKREIEDSESAPIPTD